MFFSRTSGGEGQADPGSPGKRGGGGGGATENAEVKNAGASKMQRSKMRREWISWYQTARLENARQASMDSQNSY